MSHYYITLKEKEKKITKLKSIAANPCNSSLSLVHVEGKEGQDGGADEGPDGWQGGDGIADWDGRRSWCISGGGGHGGAHGGGGNDGGACDLPHFHGGGTVAKIW